MHGRRRDATVRGPEGQFRVAAEAIRDCGDLVGAVLNLAAQATGVATGARLGEPDSNREGGQRPRGVRPHEPGGWT